MTAGSPINASLNAAADRPERDAYRSPLDRWGAVLRSECCKLYSLRSTSWTLGSAVAVNVASAALVAVFIPPHLSAHDRATTDGVRLSLAGLHLSQVAFGVLGTLIITSEYRTGMIRASLAAVPARRLVLASKALIFTGTALIVGIVSCVAAYAIFRAALSGGDMGSALGDPGVIRAVIGGGLYLTVVGLLGFGFGAILRSSAGGIASLFGLLFVPSILVDVLPGSWQTTIGGYLPMNAGEQIFIAAHHDTNSLAAWAGFAVFSGYAALALTVAFVLIGRRDA